MSSNRKGKNDKSSASSLEFNRKSKIKPNVPISDKKVISFSLWGDSVLYWFGALRNIYLARMYYPDWICRFYVDETASRDRIEALRRDNTEVILKRRLHDFDGAFWRFLAASDPNVRYVLFRDCDSRIGPREVAAVNAWIRSGKNFHLMRDHPWHRTQILAGMWGCRAGVLPNIDTMVFLWDRFGHKGVDQEFLTESVYPLFSGHALEHSEFGIAYDNPTKSFPTKRRDFEFVGEIFDEEEQRNEDHRHMIIEALSDA